MAKMSLMDWLNYKTAQKLTKKKFGKIMHQPEYTEAERQRALKQMEEAGGYAFLAED